jgi:hypothetical protein
MDEILAIDNEPSDERSYEPRVRARARNRPTTRHGHGAGIAATRFDPIVGPVLSPDRLQLTPTIEQRPIPPKSLTKPALEPAKVSAKDEAESVGLIRSASGARTARVSARPGRGPQSSREHHCHEHLPHRSTLSRIRTRNAPTGKRSRASPDCSIVSVPRAPSARPAAELYSPPAGSCVRSR